ncbi:MAG: biotin/lipoyl-containing protein [Terrimicrobiaceae bacterium]|nr:biotin/lipoyl-containing protein [Terrimicrobiaceae bacterium]
MKKLRVTVDGRTYEVLVEAVDESGRSVSSGAPAPLLQQSSVAPPVGSAPKPAQAPAAGAGSIVSPLAGRIVSVDCQVGQKVASGDKLVTVEAMKMNTFVYADAGGTVATIGVQTGDVVEEGQVLVTLS